MLKMKEPLNPLLGLLSYVTLVSRRPLRDSWWRVCLGSRWHVGTLQSDEACEPTMWRHTFVGWHWNCHSLIQFLTIIKKVLEIMLVPPEIIRSTCGRRKKRPHFYISYMSGAKLRMANLTSRVTTRPNQIPLTGEFDQSKTTQLYLSLIHIWRCRRIERCRSRWSPYH